MMVLGACEPKQVFRFFEEISQIPRGSGNEQAVSDHIAAFARGKGLRVEQDTHNNLIIYKPGSPGYADHAPLILQGHLDMVCEKNMGTEHDFLCEPIKLRIDGDFISAEGTTLGADNGIAVAMCMALVDADDVAHPPLEIVLTADEEAGMSGAENIDASLLTARRMINMDTDHEGTFFAGCAGGVRASFSLPIGEWAQADEDALFYEIVIKGLKGGHSGEEIDKERGNSIRLLARLLRRLDDVCDMRIQHVSGGMKINAIPREASALITIRPEDAAHAIATVEAFNKEIAIEYRTADPGLTVTLKKQDRYTLGIQERELKWRDTFMPLETGRALINILLLLPLGPLHMHTEIPNLVETSCNIGVLETKTDSINIEIMPRGAVSSRVQVVKAQITALAALTGAQVTFSHEYPGWAYNPASPLKEEVVALYHSMYNKDPKVAAIHAGLECGILGDKLPGLDIISFGPNAWDIHTPDERLSISSTERVWVFLLALLEKL